MCYWLKYSFEHYMECNEQKACVTISGVINDNIMWASQMENIKEKKLPRTGSESELLERYLKVNKPCTCENGCASGIV